MITKTCSGCGRTLGLSEFRQSKVNKDGYEGRCRDCQRKRQEAYCLKHRERRLPAVRSLGRYGGPYR